MLLEVGSETKRSSYFQCPLWFTLIVYNVNSGLPVPAALPAATTSLPLLTLPLEPYAKINHPLSKSLLVVVFPCSNNNKKVTSELERDR